MDAIRRKAPEALWRALDASEPQPFIVAVATTPDSATDRLDRGSWTTHKDALLRALDDAASDDLVVEQTWSELPLVQVRATSTSAAIAALASDEALVAYPIERYELMDAESFPLINQPSAVAAGATGAGTAVAVLDTGAIYSRADLGSCTSPGMPSTCRVAYAADFATNDNSLDDNGHGTNVSSIVAGVAPGTKILALDVFAGSGAYTNDIINAINWVIANKATYNIAAMNLSLGGGSSTVPCTSDAMGTAIASARTAGIAAAVASGNNGYTNAISSPGCAPASISVGAVYDTNVGGLGFSNCSDPTTYADKITCFSNSASFLTLLAPGAMITAGGYTMAGTSQATPHIAGALAALHGAFPAESVDQLVARLTSTGKLITDARNNVTKARIDLYAAVGAPPVDVVAPTGSVSINAGASYTKTGSVTLAITATDDSAPVTMCVSNTTTCTTFGTLTTPKTWTLAAGDGTKTVSVFLRDAKGNTTTATSSPKASIVLDATVPTNGTLTATPSAGQVALAWTGFADALSGIAEYRVMAAASTTAPTTCATGTPIYTGPETSFTATNLVNGTTYSYRVCAVDRAGNVSAGVVASARPAPEYEPPTGALQINSGAELTKTTAVTLTIAASDASGVASMCVSNSTTCTAFSTFATTKAWTLATGDGVKTVYVFLRDIYNNTTVAATSPSDTIRLDMTLPGNGTVTATPGDAQASLAWTGFSDAGSGIAAYRVMMAAGATAPTTCTTGTPIFTGLATSFVATGLVNGTTYSFRVCAVDAAGNVSAGAIASAAPRPEFNAPTGSVVINSGAELTKSRTVTLTLAATDDTSVASMCIGEGTTCATFVPYTTTATFTVAADGVRTVKVWFRDRWGNTAQPVSDSINVDTIAPTGGTLASTAGTNQVSLSWTAATDANSGLAGYKLVGLAGTVVPASACTTGTVLYTGTATTFVHTFALKSTWSYRLCAFDRAGNVSAGTTKTVTSL